MVGIISEIISQCYLEKNNLFRWLILKYTLLLNHVSSKLEGTNRSGKNLI